MATNFPTSLDNLTNPAGSDPVNNPSHASQHANLNDAIEVLEAKVGVNNSAVTTSLDYRVKQLETNPVASYTNEEAVDAVALALAAGTHSNITINYNDTGNSISISAAAGYTDEEARDAVALALRGSGGITISSDDSANTITISVDSTIATKTYVDTAVSNLGSTAASTYVLDSSVGNADGVASLDATGQVPFSQLGNIVNSAPATLNTLNELATALGNDANFATTTATSIGNKVSKAGGDIITSSLPGVISLVLKGAASQTANLQEWQNSAGIVLATVSNGGTIKSGAFASPTDLGAYINFNSTSGAMLVGTRAPANIGVIVKGEASQTANLQEWQNSAGTVLAKVTKDGDVFSGGLISNGMTSGYTGADNVLNNLGIQASSFGLSYFRVKSGSAGAIVALIDGATSQTGDLTQWRNGAGTVLSKVDSTGAIFTITPATGTNTTQVATTAFVQSEIDANVQPGALYQTSAPSSPAVGQIWIDSDEDVTTFDSNIIRRKAITATAGQTVFTADLPFIDGFEQIFMNGLLLVKTTDYATSGGNTVTLTSGAAASDVIEIVSVTGANSIETYTQAETNALLAANTSVAPLSISANTTLVAKKRYFVTSASALTLTLPASPALNDEIQILDASGNSSTYNITVARNANKINGGNNNLIIDTNGGWYTLLYTGSTYGWKVG